VPVQGCTLPLPYNNLHISLACADPHDQF